MTIGFLKDEGGAITPIVPSNISKLNELFEKVYVEAGIGSGAFYTDGEFEGAEVKSCKEIMATCDVIVRIDGKIEMDQVKKGAILMGQFAPFNDPSVAEVIAKKGLHAFSLDMIPRTTLAQSMDVLSSMGSIAGYQAILVALQYMPRYMPMMITAAGSIKPSKVLVIGAGVAGLQAIATAKRLGATVEAFDTRSAVREEVQSLGARFVEVEGARDDKDAGGYAVEQTEEYKKRQAELVQEKSATADIVVTTAQLRGRPAPKIVMRETVERMKAGSVIVDLAASTGGNCVLTKDGEVVNHNNVFIIGDSNLAARMPQDASIMYSNNVVNYLKHIVKDGNIDLGSQDEILSGSLITK